MPPPVSAERGETSLPDQITNSEDLTPLPENETPVLQIDPDLVDLPAPAHNPPSHEVEHEIDEHEPPTLASIKPDAPMGITESIASAPNPRHTDFTPPDFDKVEEEEEGGIPGSPTTKAIRAVAPPNAMMPDPKWPPPPPNASVNLFIGRALLSHGNDNWPLHYPSEWDGDEGRCSAHRVRTYLARKGADMYYEKLNQGCIAGWRIRQNHLWRFENGGFQGRGMKQEEAIAQAQKESEAVATAAHKLAAAEALAQGHPGIKVSMSTAGISDGGPTNKRQRVKGPSQSRRNRKKEDLSSGLGDQSFYQATANFDLSSANGTTGEGSGEQTDTSGLPIDPMLIPDQQEDGMDINMVHQAMQAAAAANAGQIDELEIGMPLPIEMQMHGEGDEGDERYRGDEQFYGNSSQTGHSYGSGNYGYEGGQVYGYQQR
ncbi:hypothetical protein TREMEDRAFT_63872 [Tremella mesenterica DSM 1558]|uniref:uncharacterized protein n=1 Tax=Tremella mesenterica (strain ATCC 24925 / CBS 8224 / DSM 1558 / NBRC 9311 / NRRL Y-6157 / RJB 2259-6 / UBC 559-6) TaxID=578456 RepID=UPI0003F48F75|nr:uncharacterized protein TREMEDRAFT_63872 [Tremella mesenterica DSM 1558]EIW67988.1 hypothetical protein TREMEDRAFT_63872 [Tremella mesenterica DSM 1558]